MPTMSLCEAARIVCSLTAISWLLIGLLIIAHH
jgi:hypothetical protein